MKSSSSTLSVHLTDIECESEPAAAAARLTATRHVPSLYPRHRMMSSSHIIHTKYIYAAIPPWLAIN